MNRKQEAARLRKARAFIGTPEKWGKGTLRDERCAMDACYSTDANWERLETFIPEDCDAVWVYNDRDDTTHDDIMTVFDWAIGTIEAGVEL